MKLLQFLFRVGIGLFIAFIASFSSAGIFFDYSGYENTSDRIFLVMVPTLAIGFLLVDAFPRLWAWFTQRQVPALIVFGAIASFAAVEFVLPYANHALDLSASIGVPVRAFGGRLTFQVDVFNLVSTETGMVDRALVLVDPSGAVVDDGLGNLTLPLVGNRHFGKLLSQRTEPRMLRVGLRLGY